MVFALSFLIISYLQVLSSKFIKSNHCCFSIYSFHVFYLYKSRTTKNFKRILWEPLCKDFTRMKRNLKRKWLLLLFVVTGVFGLTACSDDYEPWELLTAEMTSTLPEQPNLVPWDGGTFTINVKTNGAWDMVVPDWMTVDQNKGFGDAVVNASITQNESSTRRTGDISIKFIGDTKASVAGINGKTISFLQEALYDGSLMVGTIMQVGRLQVWIGQQARHATK